MTPIAWTQSAARTACKVVLPLALIAMAACEQTRQPTAPELAAGSEIPSFNKGKGNSGGGDGGAAGFTIRAYGIVTANGEVLPGHSSGLVKVTRYHVGMYCIETDPAAFPGGKPIVGVVSPVQQTKGSPTLVHPHGHANACGTDATVVHVTDQAEGVYTDAMFSIMLL